MADTKHNPGKYDEQCTVARESTEAEAVVVIIVNGNKGTGFSVQTLDESFIDKLPDLLEIAAQQIRLERNLKKESLQ